MRTPWKVLIGILVVSSAVAGTTIDPVHRYAYGSNVGWVDWRPDATNGAAIGEFVCSGYCYGANIGWICLGHGSPTNGIRYANASAADFGVNHLGQGRLRGFAWAGNVGWLNFEDRGDPRVDLITGDLSGSVWAANLGWIALSNLHAHVQTTSLSPGDDTDHDQMPDAWELAMAGNLTTLQAGKDYDRDGVPDQEEYVGGTDPLKPDSRLEITRCAADGQGTASLEWQSSASRCYRIERNYRLTDPAGWTNCGLFAADAGTNTSRTIAMPAGDRQFFRVQALRPLDR